RIKALRVRPRLGQAGDRFRRDQRLRGVDDVRGRLGGDPLVVQPRAERVEDAARNLSEVRGGRRGRGGGAGGEEEKKGGGKSHTSLNCGVAFASKKARISDAGLREISSRGDSSYQSLGKKRVYVSCVKRRQRSAITPMSLSLRMTRPADCTTRVIPGIR